jgi:hypothetical protein
MLAEVRAALPAIHANATAPAGKEGVTKAISAKFVTYPQPQRNEAEWAQFWADYHAVLEGLPQSALDAAMTALLSDPSIEFLPKPAKIAELAKMTPNRAVRAYDRAKAAVEHQAPVQREKLSADQMADLIKPLASKRPAEKSEADKARVRQQMREFIAQDEARKKAAREVKPQCDTPLTPTDETGLTTAMRELLARKSADFD